MREDLKKERVNSFLTLAYNEVRRQRTAPYELVQLTTVRAQGYRTPLPALNPAVTSTSDGMQSADNTMGGHKEIFRSMQLSLKLKW